MTAAKTVSERMQAMRDKKRAGGLWPVQLWLTKAEEKQVRKFVEQLIEKRKPK
jgi:hypothetical protein